MIEQYLSNKNESATVAKFEIFSELNKALVQSCLFNYFFFKILYHIKNANCQVCANRKVQTASITSSFISSTNYATE